MNLRSFANTFTRAVNADLPLTVQVSAGYSTAPDGTQVPAYEQLSFLGNVQSASGGDIMHTQGMNVQRVNQVIYLNGTVEAVRRVSEMGGDLITFPDGSIWLTAAVLERWGSGTWCKVAVVLQDQTAAAQS